MVKVAIFNSSVSLHSSTKLIFKAVLILNLLSSISSNPKVCQKSDEKYLFTECIDFKRKALFYYPPTECDNSNNLIPNSPVLDINCRKSCDKGSYLGLNNLMQEQCIKCKENTYSLGGGLRIDGALNEWSKPSLFDGITSYGCAKASDRFSDYYKIHGCKGWSPQSDGEFIQTHLPDKAQVGKFYEIWMQMGVKIVKEGGEIRFQFKKDTKTEVFKIFRNGVLTFIDNDVIKKQFDNVNTSTQDQKWQSFSYPLKIGYHTIMWAYAYHYSNQDTKLSAIIRKIQIDSVDFAHTYCKTCQTGRSKEGSYSCIECDSNQFYNENSLQCEACPGNKISVPGSLDVSQCIQPPSCSDHDMEITYSECKNGKRTLKHQWRKSSNKQSCVVTESFKLPEDKEEPCPPCEKGQHLIVSKSNHETCENCPKFTFNDKAGRQKNSCKSCQDKNQIPVKSLILTKFDHAIFEKQFIKQCYYQKSYSDKCQQLYGWRVNSKGMLVTGSNLNQDVIIAIRNKIPYDFETNSPERQIRVSISWPQNKKVSGQQIEKFQILVDGSLIKDSFLSRRGGKQQIKFQVDHGLHNITFRYLNKKSAQAMGMTIESIFVKGIKNGGGVECKNCPNGTIVNKSAATCGLCRPGTESNKEATECNQCQAGMFNLFKGKQCQQCPDNTESDPKTRTFCEPKKIITHENKNYHEYILDFFKSQKLIGIECGFQQNSTHQQRCQNPGITGPILQGKGDIFNEPSFYLSGLSHGSFHNHTTLRHIAGGKSFDQSLPSYIQGIFQEQKQNSTSSDEIKLYKQNLGSVVVNTTFEEQSDDTLAPNVLVQFGYGDYCNLGEGSNNQNEEDLRYSSDIRFVCDLNQDQNIVYLPSKQLSCNFQFIWYSKYACSRCRLDQVQTLNGACSGGQRSVTYFRKSGELCYLFVGEQPSADPRVVSDFFFESMQCSETEDLVHLRSFWIFLTLGIVLLALLIVVIVLVCKKFRKVKQDYQRLLPKQQKSSDTPSQPRSQQYNVSQDVNKQGGELQLQDLGSD